MYSCFMKLCRVCNTEKDLAEFYSAKANKDGLEHRCKQCKYISTTTSPNRKTVMWRSNIKTRYGLTEDMYNKILQAQGGVCAGCKQPCKRGKLSVDHDHKTNKVRGLLCRGCNSALGNVLDNPQTLWNLAEYLNQITVMGGQTEAPPFIM